MTEPQSLSVTFAPGTRAACATSTMVLLVDRPLSDELVLRAWESMSRGDEAAQIVDILMTDGMIHAPHFALVALPDHHTTRIVVRGSLSVLGVEEGGEFHTSGGSLLTDESRGRLVRARITAEAITRTLQRVKAGDDLQEKVALRELLAHAAGVFARQYEDLTESGFAELHDSHVPEHALG